MSDRLPQQRTVGEEVSNGDRYPGFGPWMKLVFFEGCHAHRVQVGRPDPVMHPNREAVPK